MSTVTKVRQRVKPPRTIRLSLPPSADSPEFIITITEGKEQDDYLVRPIPADYGQAFTVQKIFDPDQNSYAVDLHGSYGSCECKGHLRWGHCRHVGGLLTLRQNGKL